MKLKIYAVGDIMLGEQHLCNNFGVKKIIQKNGADFLFKEVSPIFKDGDLVFGNLECSIMDGTLVSNKEPVFFCAEPDAINGLKFARFNVLSVANNHIMEHGQKNFQNTIQILKNNGIIPVGIRKKIDVLNIKGWKIAFLAYSFIEDNIVDGCFNKVQSEEVIIEDVQKVKPISDLIIVSLHWGCEYIPYPSPDQIQIGRNLVDVGVDIILGGHPHVTQGFEYYKNRPIFYSLGNFIFDDTYIKTTRKSFIAEITIGDSLDLIDVNIIPVMINKEQYQPRLVKPPEIDCSINSVDTTRNIFENLSLLEYVKSIGDYNLLYSKYNRTAKWDMKVQFIKNFYRFSFSTTFGILKQFFSKELGDRK